MSCSCFPNKIEIYQYTTSTDFIIGHDSKLAFKSFSQLKTHIKNYIKVEESYKLYDLRSRKVTKCKRKAEFRVLSDLQANAKPTGAGYLLALVDSLAAVLLDIFPSFFLGWTCSRSGSCWTLSRWSPSELPPLVLGLSSTLCASVDILDPGTQDEASFTLLWGGLRQGTSRMGETSLRGEGSQTRYKKRELSIYKTSNSGGGPHFLSTISCKI